MVERAGFVVVFYLTFPMTCLWSRWDRVPVAGVGVPGWRRSLRVSVCGLRSRQQQRWRDEDSGGGRRECREGGELKGTEEREGESFRGTLTPSLLLSPRHSSPQLGLPWSCHGNREASKTRQGGWD